MKPALVVTQAIASSSVRLSTPNLEPAGTRIASPAAASSDCSPIVARIVPLRSRLQP